ncbi:conserved hypothetical protein [Ancylobacter novellus DSM 506]|uniref:MxaH protein n=1 Tax=Ancylobacter novellus (strain ATCC 8093 / DSM 506 / JCM 20403 / CCM 1077 / IAM 12100 / NBRC 12443 / NCIMB 10456) TaxID=639283 RepID=D7A1N1_ANCN5|nr:hypothetical protein [Ancylobacter novellus]ADH91456.1 conserved hypothetical protein [Ancylobacter novellus DSM 506]
MNVVSLPLARALFGAVLAFALAGCPDEGEREKRERVAAPASDAIARKTWLQPTDGTAPDVWLASRAAGADVAPTDPAVAPWHALLADADERFGETDRMIANRAVQLETMLGEIDVREGVREIVTGFAALAPKGSRSGFSDLCQHYFNLRSQGSSREAALATLRAEPHRAAATTAPEGGTP